MCFRRQYPTNLTNRQWNRLQRMLPKPKRRGRRPIDRRRILDAIRYQNRTGCQWRMLPRDFPNWSTVYGVFRRLQVAFADSANGKNGLPDWVQCVCGFLLPRLMENLCHLALAGPILEILHRGRPCTVSAIKEHEHDWHQAWAAAGFLHHDETERVACLDRQIALGERYISLPSWQAYIGPIAQHLSTNGTMRGSDVQAIWDRIKGEHESRFRRPINRRLFDLYADDADEEWDAEPYPE
ncbi:transposase [Thalassoroseus pseudoceratinae]|uniref:transposase n=1 Tax=Thalassoroseus pseudoceratinae TaxID=2713176 RepID=UPI001423C61E|nr:transposase [Thalassoroseus pseudoceratinae]